MAKINLDTLPLAPDPDPERTARETRDLLVEDGRAAFRCGFLLKECPPFKDPDMAINWRNGWRWEKEDQKQREKQP